jgi:ATP-dependent helicase HrpB
LAIAHLDARDGMGKIFMASPLNPRDLSELIQEKENIQWNSKKGAIIASKELRLGNLVLKSTPLQNLNPSLIQKVICDAIKKDGAHLLDWNENVTQFQNRILSLQQWNPNETWPDVSTNYLLKTCDDWLQPYLINIKNNEDLKKLNLSEILLHFLDYAQQQELNQKAPSKLEVPSGSVIKISYSENGTAPVLAVRIQEIFGLSETPSVNQGKIGLILHLLSPAFKPVQITSDLKNFWKNTYFEVKKELKQRYPKHAWPDEPWNHQAIRGTKKQNGLK